jgi:hypothetical protein
MTANFEVLTRDAIGGDRSWFVADVRDEDEASAKAAKAAALDHIASYNSYSGDSRYLEALAQAAKTIEIVSVDAASGPTRGRPVANAVYLLPCPGNELSAPSLS